MKCHQAEQTILLLDSGELGTVRRHQLERHLRGCAACRAFQSDLLASRRALQAIPTPAQAVRDRTALLEAATPHPRTVFSQSPVPQPLNGWRPALAAAALLVLLLAGWLIRQGQEPVVADSQRKAPAAAAMTLDEAVDAEMDALQELLVASTDDTGSASAEEELDENTLARELLALQEVDR